jgi:quinol monooxygenase YgiN
MYARSTTVRGDRQAMDDGIAYVRDKVMPAVGQMDGCVGLSMLCDRDTGRCIVTTSWADSAALRRSADGVLAMRRRAAELLRGDTEVHEWEITVLHRRRETHNGAVARVVWGRTDPTRLDRALDSFRMAMIPSIEDLPGFTSCSVMADRSTGRTATCVTYDSRPSMDEAEEDAQRLRERFSELTGTEVTEVAVFDVVLAHLRVPELV